MHLPVLGIRDPRSADADAADVFAGFLGSLQQLVDDLDQRLIADVPGWILQKGGFLQDIACQVCHHTI